MPYIGRNTDKLSNVEVLDNITFDGSSSYTLQKGGSNFTPSSANTLLVSIDGVVQAGNFTVSGSTIDFGTAVAATSTCDFILHYGTGLITTPADGTVTNDKINYPLAKSGATVSTFNRTTSDGDILELQKDGTEVGNIGVVASNLYIGSGDTGLKFNATNDYITPSTTVDGSGRDNAIDLANSTNRFKDLYLGGGLYVGGTGTANKLDDYEEGNWTPIFQGNTPGSYTYVEQQGHYVKIGSQVTAWFNLTNITTSTAGSGITFITGLPFSANVQSGFNNAGLSGTTEVWGFNNIGDKQVLAVIPNNTSYILLYKIGGTPTTSSAINVTDKNSDTADIRGFVTYYTGG
jgi:hypothetical protein